MPGRTYLRPTAFVDAPFGLDGRVARLAGTMAWFSAVELVACEGDRVASRELIPVAGIEAALDRLGEEARTAWRNLAGPRPPLELGARTVRLDQPQVVGILNVTPDSFSDGGLYADEEAAVAAGFAMAEAGAAIIDVGGGSTRPGGKAVWEGDEIERALPAVRRLAAGGTAVSIDTRQAGAMEAALAAGPALV